MKLKKLLGLCEEKGCFRRGNCIVEAKLMKDDGTVAKRITHHLCQKHAFAVVKESIKYLKPDGEDDE